MAKFIAEIKKPAIIDLKRIAERTEIINETTSAIRTINDEMKPITSIWFSFFIIICFQNGFDKIVHTSKDTKKS